MTSEEEYDARVRRLERRLNNLSIVGAHGVLVAGHFEQGFSVAIRKKAGTIGACCVGSSCFPATQQQCSSLGGSYLGDGVPCLPSPCPTVGACCIDGACTIGTEANCINSGGIYQGDGTDCDPNPCELPSGACCFDDGTCVENTEDQCDNAGGVFQGNDTTCTPNPCPQPPSGACCHIDGSCTIETEDECDGSYQGDGTTCETVDCTHTGACCHDGNCDIETQSACEGSEGAYQGDGTDCDPNPCELPACTGCAFLNPCDGLYYLTKTLTASGNHTDVGFPENSYWEFTSDVTFHCAGGFVSCISNANGDVTGGLNESLHGDCDGTFGGDTNTFMTLGGVTYWFYDGSGNCSPCPKYYSWTLTTDECDYNQWTSAQSGDVVNVFITYSDPCTFG